MDTRITRKYQLITLLGMLFALLFLIPGQKTFAAVDTAVRVNTVGYYKEELIVLNNGNSKIYFATEVDAAKNNWDVVDADANAEDTTMIDLSWLSPTTTNIIMVKGDKDATQSRVILNPRAQKLEISINYSNMDALKDGDTIASMINIMTTAGTGENPIDFYDLEWRKGTNGKWEEADTLTVGLLKKYLVKGTDLYFRIKALDDIITGTNYPDGTKGRRSSNEYKLKIAKNAPAAVYGVDGERFTAPIKYGKEYRVTVNNATSKWVKVTDRSIRLLPLSTVINNPAYDGTTKDKAFPAMKIEVRDYATSKAAASKITVIELDAQRTINKDIVNGKAPSDAVEKKDDNIYVSYNGNKNIVVTIPMASASLPYEYTIVKDKDTLNMSKAVWTSITKGTDIKILASKAVEGGTLYVRQKEITYKAATVTSSAVGFKLASTYVTHKISYPSIPEIVDASYTFTKGYSGDITFYATLNANGKVAFEEKIKSIKIGTKDIVFDASVTDAGGIKTMAILLKAESLKTLANCYNKAITITYTNGTIDKTSIKLTIQNPTAAGRLTVTPGKGTNPGTVGFTVVTAKAADNTWAYVITDAVISNVNNIDKISAKTSATPVSFDTAKMDNILVTAGQYITIFELNTDGTILKYKSILITDYIKP